MWIILTALVVLTITFWSSCFTGVADLSFSKSIATLFPGLGLSAQPFNKTEITVLLTLRLPRIVMGVLAGTGLALSGLVMQAITGNKMASPFTIGLSNAAALGASIVIVFELAPLGMIEISTVLSAFVFAFLCAALVYGISSIKGMGKTTIILTGIALNYFFAAFNASLQYIANEQQLAAIVYWTFGNLSGVDWQQILIISVILAVTMPYIFNNAWSFNLLANGEESAAALGVKVKQLRLISGLVVTLIAAAIVSFTGVIGFVGLVAPHIARLLVGGDYRYLTPLSALLGGILVMGADTVGRTIVSPVIIPVGIVVSFIGVPIFVFLILREKREGLH